MKTAAEISDTKTGVVIFLDALGVKHLGSKRSLEFIESRKKFIEQINLIRDKRAQEFKENLGITLPNPEIAIFQDSLIICWEEQKLDQAQEKYHFSFFHAAGQWLIDAINCAIGLKLFFRGSISHGEYIFSAADKSVTVIGPAIDDAHDYYEQVDWVGIILTKKCQDKYLSYLKGISKKEKKPLNAVIDYYRFLFVPCQVPLHTEKNDIETISKEGFFAVSWPQLTYQIKQNEAKNPILNILLDESNRPENVKFKSKYDNALAFAKWYGSTKFIPK